MEKSWGNGAFRLKKYRILWGILVLLLAVRLALPPLILKRMNQFFADFSPTYGAHIGDFDMSLWRGAYRFENFQAYLKSDSQHPFVQAEMIDLSIAWRELFRGRVLMDVVFGDLEFFLSDDLISAFQQNPQKSKEAAEKAGQKLFPLAAERIDVHNSYFEASNVPGFSPQFPFTVTSIEGRLSNAFPSIERPTSLFSLRGALLGSAPLKATGKIHGLTKPISWVAGVELREFHLTEANPLLEKTVPLTFEKGSLDFYGEIKSENGKIQGYAKPFLKQASFVGNKNDFKGLKHFGIETSLAALNLFFRNAKDHTVATKILFSHEAGKFEWNAMQMIGDLFRHGYREELTPGVENQLNLTKEK